MEDIKMGPHDIAAIPAASLWELCRSFDEEEGEWPELQFPGLNMFKHFKSLREVGTVSNNGGGVTI